MGLCENRHLEISLQCDNAADLIYEMLNNPERKHVSSCFSHKFTICEQQSGFMTKQGHSRNPSCFELMEKDREG